MVVGPALSRPRGLWRGLAVLALGLFTTGVAALDANTASQAELETIRGIGPGLSARIVEARSRQPFRDLEDLKARVRGIGDTNLGRMSEAGLGVGPAGQVQATKRAAGQPQVIVGRPTSPDGKPTSPDGKAKLRRAGATGR